MFPQEDMHTTKMSLWTSVTYINFVLNQIIDKGLMLDHALKKDKSTEHFIQIQTRLVQSYISYSSFFFANLSLHFGFIYYLIAFILLPKHYWGEILIDNGDRMQNKTVKNKAHGVLCLKLKIQDEPAME